jgi:hypothetical protein
MNSIVSETLKTRKPEIENSFVFKSIKLEERKNSPLAQNIRSERFLNSKPIIVPYTVSPNSNSLPSQTILSPKSTQIKLHNGYLNLHNTHENILYSPESNKYHQAKKSKMKLPEVNNIKPIQTQVDLFNMKLIRNSTEQTPAGKSSKLMIAKKIATKTPSKSKGVINPNMSQLNGIKVFVKANNFV